MYIKQKFAIFLVLILAACNNMEVPILEENPPEFDGQNAFKQVANQVSLGPRYPGSEGHQKVQEYIKEELERFGWMVDIQLKDVSGKNVNNIIAYRQNVDLNEPSWIILGAHYDTRLVSERDLDPDQQSEPGIGANDGASGVAVLLELARVLPKLQNSDVWLVFFDAEDNGRIPGWDWVMGSTVFVESLTTHPDKVVIVDMVGDKDQDIYIEKSSDPDLTAEIWNVASGLGISTFLPEPKHQILDDHTPFLMAGIPAIDIIDFNYPHWHTTQDTLDKISAQSLKNVGDVLFFWLVQKEISID